MSKQRIIIIGGGFAGVFAGQAITRLLKLRRGNTDGYHVELINPTNYFVFQPLLPEVVSGTINAPDAVSPLRALLPGVHFRMAEVIDLDVAKQQITLLQGSRRIPQSLSYDQLILTPGQRTDTSHLPGFAEHSFTLRDLDDAHALRNHVLQCLEHADITQNPELKQRLLTFVVVGAGFSGVETIGELKEMVHRTLRYYPNIQSEEINMILVQRGDRILPELSPQLAAYAQTDLVQRGVDVRLNSSITKATAYAVFEDDGNRISTSTLVTTVGNGPVQLATSLPFETHRGRIVADIHLRVKGHKNIWTAGDVAAVPNATTEITPATAQFAVRQAQQLAHNLIAELQGKPLQHFDYTPKGSMASLGNYRGVAEVFGVRISGLAAWFLWRGFYIAMLPGFATRLRVALNWLLDYFVPRNSVQIRNKPAGSAAKRLYAAGDVLFRPGQIVDGLYILISGKLESRSSDGTFLRVIKPGDHCGERSIETHHVTVGTLSALEDSEVLVLKREDFELLYQSLPVLRQYFHSISDNTYPDELRSASRNESPLTEYLLEGQEK